MPVAAPFNITLVLMRGSAEALQHAPAPWAWPKLPMRVRSMWWWSGLSGSTLALSAHSIA